MVQSLSETRSGGDQRQATSGGKGSQPVDVTGTYLTQCSLDQSILPIYSNTDSSQIYGCRYIDEASGEPIAPANSKAPASIKIVTDAGEQNIDTSQVILASEDNRFGYWDYVFPATLLPTEILTGISTSRSEDKIEEAAKIEVNALKDKVAFKELDPNTYFVTDNPCTPGAPECANFCDKEALKIGLGRGYELFKAEGIKEISENIYEFRDKANLSNIRGIRDMPLVGFNRYKEDLVYYIDKGSESFNTIRNTIRQYNGDLFTVNNYASLPFLCRRASTTL